MKRIQKIKLDLEDDASMDAIGLSSSYPDYRLAWTLNNVFRWRFEYRDNPLLIPAKKGGEVRHYHYHHFLDEGEKMELFLIKNRQGGKALFEEYPQFDFVLFFRNNLTFDLDQMLTLLRGLDSIFAAYRCSSKDFVVEPHLQFEGAHE